MTLRRFRGSMAVSTLRRMFHISSFASSVISGQDNAVDNASVTSMYPSAISTFDVVVATQDGKVTGVGSSNSDFGFPVAISSNVSPRVTVFAGYVLWLYSGGNILYSKDITTPAAA